MIHVIIVFADFTSHDEWFPDEELDELKEQLLALPAVVLYAAEIEDRNGHLLFIHQSEDKRYVQRYT